MQPISSFAQTSCVSLQTHLDTSAAGCLPKANSDEPGACAGFAVAERARFELAEEREPLDGLANRCLGPLDYLSCGCDSTGPANVNQRGQGEDGPTSGFLAGCLAGDGTDAPQFSASDPLCVSAGDGACLLADRPCRRRFSNSAPRLCSSPWPVDVLLVLCASAGEGFAPRMSGGGGGIRTRETRGLPVFKTGGFVRSPTPPMGSDYTHECVREHGAPYARSMVPPPSKRSLW
jgi:hypothetical protein